MDLIEDDIMVKQSTSPVTQTKPTDQEAHSDFIKRLHVEETEKLIAVFKDSILNASDRDNHNKIKQLREDVSAERYQINSTRIADKLTELVISNTTKSEELLAI